MKVYVLLWKYIEMRKLLLEDLEQVFKGNKKAAKEIVERFRALKHEKTNLIVCLAEFTKETSKGNVENVLFDKKPFLNLMSENIA